MKIIETNGITFLEQFDSSSEWYWGTNYSSGDLYEAEEIELSGNDFEPNRLIFVHYPDGKVYEPIAAKKKQYFGSPAFIDGSIYILLVAFDEKMIRVYQCSDTMDTVSLTIELPLSKVKDCYNLKLDGSPLIVTRQGSENCFEIIWPEYVAFSIGIRETFLFRKDNRLYFSEWYEDSEYREEINVRAYPSGELLEKIPGTVMTLQNGEKWILR